LDLTKRGWGELKRLPKGYVNGQEPATPESGGVSAFYRESEELAIGVVRPVHHTGQTSRVTPTGLRALYEGSSLNWQIWVRSQTCPVMAGLVR
jgi:hypothetical protein